MKHGLAAADKPASSLMADVSKAATPQTQVEVLLQVRGSD
jgi:hypothetical protein